jgi:hypothetical protein
MHKISIQNKKNVYAFTERLKVVTLHMCVQFCKNDFYRKLFLFSQNIYTHSQQLKMNSLTKSETK